MNINYIEVSNILQNLYEKKYTAKIMSRKYQKVYLDLMENENTVYCPLEYSF